MIRHIKQNGHFPAPIPEFFRGHRSSAQRAAALAERPGTSGPIPPAMTPEPGFGEFQINCVADRMSVTRLISHNPLRLLAPRTSNSVASVYATTFGGGLVQGDQIRLRGVIGPSAACILTTQASTKVYPCPAGGTSSQHLTFDISSLAALEVLADPLVCFENASVVQRQFFNLAQDASLLLLDTFTSGRWRNGERWKFARLENHIDIQIAGRPWLRDRLLLSGGDATNPLAAQFGQWNCISTLVFAGPRYAAAAKDLHERIGHSPPGPADGLIYAMWPHRPDLHGPTGYLLRAAGDSTQIVTAFLEESVGPLCLSKSLFHRKW